MIQPDNEFAEPRDDAKEWMEAQFAARCVVWMLAACAVFWAVVCLFLIAWVAL